MMFFGQDNKKRKGGSVFQTRRRVSSRSILKFHRTARRMSSAASHRKGSMTIETALVLPLFLLASLMLLSMVDMMHTYIRSEEKLFEQTRQAAVYAGKATHSIGGGSDYVEFYLPGKVSPHVRGPGYRSFLLVNHCKAHVWNGYGGTDLLSGAEDADYVYITESGTAYHKKRSCSHLNITIREVSGGQLVGERNEDGSRYRPCPYCARGAGASGTLYVTTYGNKYHTSLVCSGLKRTISVVRRDQAAGRYPCSECGVK